jgi:hypothetical protein
MKELFGYSLIKKTRLLVVMDFSSQKNWIGRLIGPS